MTETAKELLRKTKVIRDNFYPEAIEPEHEDEQKITFEFLSEVINYLENDTDSLSVEKLQEIRVEELKDFNSKILQAELKNQKLQERCDRYEKALTEIDRSRYGMQFRRSRNPNVARQALAAIGGDDEKV